MRKILDLPLDENSLLEVFSLDEKKMMVLALRGPKSAREITTVAASLDIDQIKKLIGALSAEVNEPDTDTGVDI